MMLCLTHLQSNNASSNATPLANTLTYPLATHTRTAHTPHTHAQLIYTHATHTLAQTSHTLAPPRLTRPHTRLSHAQRNATPSPYKKKNHHEIFLVARIFSQPNRLFFVFGPHTQARYAPQGVRQMRSRKCGSCFYLTRQ